MELVYLWVEKYKNIENQGFNFSPRFTCKYDKTTQELTIIKNEEHASIFPPNINITAIVGENGSGKSSVFEHINGHYTNQRNKTLLYSTSGKIIILALFNGNRICDFIEVGKKYVVEKIGYNAEAFEIIKDSMLFITNDYSSNSHHKSFTSLSIDNNINENLQLAINLIKNSQIKLPFIIPKSLFLGLHGIGRVMEDLAKSISYYLQKYEIESDFIENNLFDEDTKEYRIKRLNFYLLAVSVHSINNDLGNAYYWIVDQCNSKNPQNIDELISIYKNYLQFKENGQEKLSRVDVFIKQVEKFFVFENSFILRADIKSIPSDFIENYTAIISNEQGGFRQNYQILEFNFSDGFSSGEEQFLFLFSQIYGYIQKKKMLFIDEVELYFHPNWQRKYIYYLTEFLNKNFLNKQLNIYLATHSPFILSDLPKENVIFLEKGKQVYPFKDSEQTFGANIHTLLSHGFFMKDGLMGEFAKEKINEVIKFIKNEDSAIQSDEEAENIIKIIGEPVLKSTLKTMLDEKKYKNESKIDKLKRQQKEITKAIEKEEREAKKNEES